MINYTISNNYTNSKVSKYQEIYDINKYTISNKQIISIIVQSQQQQNQNTYTVSTTNNIHVVTTSSNYAISIFIPYQQLCNIQ